MESYDVQGLESTVTKINNKRERFELGRREHQLDKCKNVTETNFRHDERDLIRRHRHLKQVPRRYSMDADDEAELSDISQKDREFIADKRETTDTAVVLELDGITDAHDTNASSRRRIPMKSFEILLPVGATPAHTGQKELSFKESASLLPRRKKQHIKSRLFDYEKKQGRSRLKLVRDPADSSSGSGSIIDINSAFDNQKRASIDISSIPGFSGRRGSIVSVNLRRGSLRPLSPSRDPDTANGQWRMTSHDYAMHLLDSDQAKGRRESLSDSSSSEFETNKMTLNQRVTRSKPDMRKPEPLIASTTRSHTGAVPRQGKYKTTHSDRRVLHQDVASSSSSSAGSCEAKKPTKMKITARAKGITETLNPKSKVQRAGIKDDPEPSTSQYPRRRSWVPDVPSALTASNDQFYQKGSRKGKGHHNGGSADEHSHEKDQRKAPKDLEAHHVSLTTEALKEFHELINDPSFCFPVEVIPDVAGPVCSRSPKARRRMMALELLLKQLPSIKEQLKESHFDPYEMLSCRYLRLSSNNIKTLVEMCREAGLDVDYHPHMSEKDPKLMVGRPDSGHDKSPSAIPRRLSNPEEDTAIPAFLSKLRKSLPNAD